MPDRGAYARQIAAARRAALQLSVEQERAFLRLLEDYADELERQFAAGRATLSEIRRARLIREVVEQFVSQLQDRTTFGIRITARRVAEIHAQALSRLLEGSDFLLATDPAAIGASAVRAILARPELSAAFRTIRRESVAAVDRIIRRAILRNAGVASLAKELRLHVLGSDALPARLLLDRRRIGLRAIAELGYEPTAANLAAVRQDAGRVAMKAELIARTETMNTEWEAQRQSVEESPVVGLLRWRTSNRHTGIDECDALSDSDFYGYGPGLYDPRQLPPRPHPRCLCFVLHVLRPESEWGEPRPPLRTLRVSAETVGEALEFSPSRIAALTRALDIGESARRAA